DVARAGAQQKSDRIIRVILNIKGIDRHVAHLEGRAGCENPAIQPGLELAFDRLPGEAVAVDRDLELGAECGQSLDMVAVLVCKEDSVKTLGRAPEGGQPLPDLAAAETGVDEQAGFPGFQVGTIARRTAAEDGESNCHAPTLRLREYPGNCFRRLEWKKSPGGTPDPHRGSSRAPRGIARK